VIPAATEAFEVEVDGRTVRLTNLDRVLWPEVGITKGWMLRAYADLAPVLLPYLRGRPVTMWRYPEGVHRQGWWQNECRGAPPWVHEYRYVATDGREHRHCIIDDLSSLLWLVNLGTVEIHPFPFTASDPEAAPWLVFDLDPGEPAGLREACSVGLRLRDVLSSQGLTSFPKTSGEKGLHVFVPLHTEASFDETKAYARTMAAFMVRELREAVVDRQARELRGGKVLVDWLQNDRSRSTVAAYSLRATPSPLVSTPVTWDEVGEVAAGSPEGALEFGVQDVLARVDRDGDLFEPVLRLEQRLVTASAPTP
jgi:bifunctional non-homologous end joining protein LigD